MSGGLVGGLVTGVLLPETVLHSEAVKILATFVALNTLMYATLALLKILPKWHLPTLFGGRNRRMRNRSIHPGPLRHNR